jgi:hypothetical protein
MPQRNPYIDEEPQNGVILVQLKGKQEEAKVAYNGFSGIQA